MRPFDPRLLTAAPQARPAVVALGVIGVLQGAATIATAFALTAVVVAVARQTPLTAALAALVSLFASRALLTALGEYVAARAGIVISTTLRTRLLAAWAQPGGQRGTGGQGGTRVGRGQKGRTGAAERGSEAEQTGAANREGAATPVDGADPAGAPDQVGEALLRGYRDQAEATERDSAAAWANPARRLTLATSGCASVEPYVARFLPALVTASIVPVAAIAVLAWVDWPSALVVVLTVPLLPLFAALIGRSTEQETARRWRALADLAGHFLDVVRGLPTLVNFGRAERQLDSIADVSRRHRIATMRTLRLAFMSSAALELLATISVAIVAVLCGVRLAAGHMPLEEAMLAILLAPEAYWPIRRVGQEFHSAADGAEAAADILAALDAEPSLEAQRGIASAPGADARVGSSAAPGGIRLRGVHYRYPGSGSEVLTGIDLEAGPGLTVITGPSGVGKTTLLEVIAGLRVPDRGESDLSPAHLVTQRPFLPTGPLSRILALGNGAGHAEQRAALREVGLEPLLDGLPDGLDSAIGDDGFGLSAGQRARVGLARALLAPQPVILLDEPTAHLDEAAAEHAHRAITRLARERCVIVVTHRPELLALAQAHLDLSALTAPVSR